MKLSRIIRAFKRSYWKGSRLYDANGKVKRVSLYILGDFWRGQYKFEVIEKTSYYSRSTLYDRFSEAKQEFDVLSTCVNG